MSIAYYFVTKNIADEPVTGWHCTYTGPGKEANSGPGKEANSGPGKEANASLGKKADSTEEADKIFYLNISVIPQSGADSILKSWGLTAPVRGKK